MCPAQAGGDLGMRNMIGIFSMCHRPYRNCLGQIIRHPAAQILIHNQRAYPALLIKPDLIDQLHIMTFAGDPHIIIPVIDQPGRAACFAGRQRGDTGGQVALAFLAAETAAHPPDLNLHIMIRQP